MDTIAPLTAALAGRYDIIREIGRGGMATVYLARDVKHDRNVALKVLHAELGAVLGAERFLTEIRTTANLQHPNILPLFDSGTEVGLVFYVMPYVEGETLRDRVRREGQLSIADAVRFARGVAAALDYAHRRGVIHRDIKPENILLQDGQALVADFGVALAVSSAGGARVTQTGISVGTPQYMSPEQAAAERQLDGRSDQYSLASVIYELLAGEPPFTGPSAPMVMSRLMTETPRLVTERRPSVPPHIADALATALEKVPSDRFPTAGEFAEALVTEKTGAYRTRTAPAVVRSPRGLVAGLAVATIVAVVASIAAIVAWRRPTAVSAAAAYRFSVPASERIDDALGAFRISPDGSALAYVLTDSIGTRTLWIRRLDSLSAYQVAGSEDASFPFWAPNGRSVAFYAQNKLKRVDLGGGRPYPLADVTPGHGAGIWLASDQILFVPTGAGPLMRVAATGGTVTEATKLDSARGDARHANPSPLPDGKHFLFVASPPAAGHAVTVMASLDGGAPKVVVDGTAGFAAPNWLLLIRGGEVKALRFDPKTGTVSGEPVTVITGDPVIAIDASTNGVLAYRTMQRGQSGNDLMWLDRSGRRIGTLGPHATSPADDYWGPRLSPDARSVAFEHHNGQGGGDVFLYDVNSQKTIRQTFDPTHHNAFIVWSPDSKRLVFQGTRGMSGDLYLKAIDGSAERIVLPSRMSAFPDSWSSDGFLLITHLTAATGYDIERLPMSSSAETAPATPTPVLNTVANEIQAALSPDGKWLAYASDEQDSRYEVYVRRFPPTAEQWRISTSGGEAPRWGRDGKELYYLGRATGDALMAVPVETGATFKNGTPRELFRRPFKMGLGPTRGSVNYDVMPDGQRFVAVVYDSVAKTSGPMMRVFVNWTQVLGAAK